MNLVLRLDKILEERPKPDGKRLTQIELARLTGIPQSTLSKWIGGKVDRYDGDILQRLCFVLKCNVSDLLEIDWQGNNPVWQGSFDPYPGRGEPLK